MGECELGELVNRVHHCSAESLLGGMPADSTDLIIADPPYGIGYRAGCATTNGGKKRRAASNFGEDVLQMDWIPDAYRVLKPCTALYLFTRWDVMHFWKVALESAGFRVVQRLVWDKLHWGTGNLDYYGSQTEDILFCVKGRHRLRWSQRSGNLWRLTKLDVINYEGNLDNPTQKPERLLQKIILNSSDPGHLVLDPFCGTGTTGDAARKLSREYILCDRDEYQVTIAKKRLANAYTPEMFSLIR